MSRSKPKWCGWCRTRKHNATECPGQSYSQRRKAQHTQKTAHAPKTSYTPPRQRARLSDLVGDVDVVGRTKGSEVWHIVRLNHPRAEPRRPRALKGRPWLLSFCSLVWTVDIITLGEVTCPHCRDRYKPGNGNLFNPLVIGKRKSVS